MDRTEANSGTREVGGPLRFDERALETWLQAHVPGFTGPLGVRQFKGGQSNPTYRLDTPAGAYVLRRKPPGKLLPGAHAFYLMDMVPGRIVWEAHFPGLAREQRAAHFDAMNATIARLHSFEPDALGLGDYGRAGGFVERQVKRWAQQYLSDEEGGRLESMDRLVDWLGKHLPPDSGQARIAHGDFRCDNMVFDADEPEVRAVLDWELSTLGDPAADFTYHCLMYRMPAGLFTGLAGLDLDALGIPSEQEYVAAYCRRTGREAIASFDYLIVFCLFRLAAIIHGIKGRMARGSASSAHAAQSVQALEPLAELAWTEAQRARV
jgi:aminoglycoside phosphotransferase (APT) family kinase protein